MFFFFMIVLATSMPLQEISSLVGTDNCGRKCDSRIKTGTCWHVDGMPPCSTPGHPCYPGCWPDCTANPMSEYCRPVVTVAECGAKCDSRVRNGSCWLVDGMPPCSTPGHSCYPGCWEPCTDKPNNRYCKNCVVKHGMDILAGTFVHCPATRQHSISNEDCNQLCAEQTGCVAWVRQPSTGLCWMSKQTGTIKFEAEADRDCGLVC